ncbi:MAG: hypothetical protein KAH22_10705 [Thiotrichaceae bacterium]|nr:hypothetical protein [Thiotrichaceae bacterium]
MKPLYKGLGVLSAAIGVTVVAINFTGQAKAEELQDKGSPTVEEVAKAGSGQSSLTKATVAPELTDKTSINTNGVTKSWSSPDKAPPGLYFKSGDIAKVEPTEETTVATEESAKEKAAKTETKVNEELVKEATADSEVKTDTVATDEESTKEATADSEVKTDTATTDEESTKEATADSEVKTDTATTDEESTKEATADSEVKTDTATMDEESTKEATTASEVKTDTATTDEESTKEAKADAEVKTDTTEKSTAPESEQATEVKPAETKQFMPLEPDVVVPPVGETKVFPVLDANGMLPTNEKVLDPSKVKAEKPAKPSEPAIAPAPKIMPSMSPQWMLNPRMPQTIMPSPNMPMQQGWNYPQGMPQQVPLQYPYMPPNMNRMAPYYGYMPRIMYVPVYPYRQPASAAKKTVAPTQQGANPLLGN